MKNEGLYIKLGQGLNSLSHVLPKEYTQTLKVLLDDAPPVGFDVVQRIVEEEAQRPLSEVFSEFDPVPVAAASIAQVHRARLREGTEVAVKVRKPCITKQGEWDIRTYSLVSTLVEYLFGLPTAWSRRTIVDGLRRETDFTIEAANAARFREDFRHNRNVYIPKVFEEYTTKKLLVLEWIDALKLTETEKVRERFGEKKVLKIVFDAFGDMLFKNGFVHCDPHAANVLVRHRPSEDKKESSSSSGESKQTPKQKGSFWSRRHHDPQVVFIDFGLSAPVTERFRVEYALLFKSIFTHDFDSLKKVASGWGLGNAESFASMQIQKPIDSMRKGNYDEITLEEVRGMQRNAHARMKTFLLDEAKIPRELPLVGRGIDILRGINRLYDSPINRLNMFVQSAVEGLGPISDYEAAEQYLKRIEERQKVLKSKKSTTTTTTSKAVDSVFDRSADEDRLQKQEIIREIKAERTANERFRQGLIATYRNFIFHCRLWQIHILYLFTRYVALLSRWILPDSMRVNPNLLEDKIEERMESNIKIE
ncbi:aarF domain-containing kinase [Angomonas deanei]|uniref:ABC1 family, putative n=1 Tax=Angomonas deanei TaxID=59799 RepID=A0A7G2C265_9TRYP|nr:aarF domain-containing kinase [Angomonas deanei]CAD2212797.1 ABC1 family, putative [Angomonas deanei]|eukprot:EPY20629.1 aarF domain-containing kinase [Angomonas deanei]